MRSVVLMGTPSFCVPILTGLIRHHYQIRAVVTQPDRPTGRKHVLTASPAKRAALKYKIPVLQPQKLGGSPEMAKVIRMRPDFIITAAYGQFLPTKLLKSARVAAVNVHGSLLPKYRGGAPIQYALLNGDSKTGVTIMYMVKKMDAGNIISQKSLPIRATDDAASLFKKLSYVGRDLLLQTLPKIVDGTAPSVPQDPSRVVFSPTIKRSQARLDFKQSAREIDDRVRALRPDPGAYAIFNHQRVKIWQTKPLKKATDQSPGTIVAKTKHQLEIATGHRQVIQIKQLQRPGKSRQSITDFLNGPGQKLNVGDQVIKV